MFQITILFLYIIAGVSFALSRLPSFASRSSLALGLAFGTGVAGLAWHSQTLWSLILVHDGLSLSIGNTASLIGLQLALIAMVGGLQPTVRGLAGGLLLLAAAAAAREQQ